MFRVEVIASPEVGDGWMNGSQTGMRTDADLDEYLAVVSARLLERHCRHGVCLNLICVASEAWGPGCSPIEGGRGWVE